MLTWAILRFPRERVLAELPIGLFLYLLTQPTRLIINIPYLQVQEAMLQTYWV
jgi:hypothetical protein